jgi:hypothetical protein
MARGDDEKRLAMTGARYRLEWAMPQDLDLMTRVTLLEERWPITRLVHGVGFGADKPDTLLDLWVTLVDADAPDGAVAYAAAAFTKRTGRPPARPVEALDA